MTESISTSNNDWDFIRKVYANKCDENEFEIFKHLAETYSLDPISKEIWCIKGTGNQPARIFVSRDGHLAIAHRSGQWGSMEHVYDWGDEKQYIEVKDKYSSKVARVLVPFSVTVIIYRKDFPNPTKHTVFWDEYGSNTGLWATKPKTMLLKVAECQGLRRAFDMHGFYAPEEINDLKIMDAQTRDSAIEEDEKNYPPELFTARKNRVPTELPADDYVSPELKGVKITNDKQDSKVDDDDVVSGANPENVKDFEAFVQRVSGMFQMKVSEDQRNSVLNTPGDYETKKNLLKEKIVEQARKEGRI